MACMPVVWLLASPVIMKEVVQSPTERGPSDCPPRDAAVSVSTNASEGFCRVPGCPPKSMENASNYCLRHHICKEHFRAVIVMVDGKEHRFCQKCSRLHEVHVFEGSQRSCRESLELRKKRHRQQTENRNKLKQLEQQEADAKRLKTRAAAATSSWHLQAEQAQQLKGMPHNAEQRGLNEYLMNFQTSLPASQVLAAALQHNPAIPTTTSSASLDLQIAHLLGNGAAGLLTHSQQAVGSPNMSSVLSAMLTTLRPQTLPSQGERASLPVLAGLSAPGMNTWPAAPQPQAAQAPSLATLAKLVSQQAVANAQPEPGTSQADTSVKDLANLLSLYQQQAAVQYAPQPLQDDGVRKLLEMLGSTASVQAGASLVQQANLQKGLWHYPTIMPSAPGV